MVIIPVKLSPNVKKVDSYPHSKSSKNYSFKLPLQRQCLGFKCGDMDADENDYNGDNNQKVMWKQRTMPTTKSNRISSNSISIL